MQGSIGYAVLQRVQAASTQCGYGMFELYVRKLNLWQVYLTVPANHYRDIQSVGSILINFNKGENIMERS